MSKRPAPGAEQGTAVNILRRAANASDLFPPLKAVAEIALNVAELVEDFRANKTEWQELGAYVRDVTATVIQSMDQIDPSQEGNRVRLEKLKSALDNTANRIQSEQTQRKGNRFGRFLGDPDMIANMKVQLEEAIEFFQLGAITTTMVESTKTLDMVAANGQILSTTAADTASIEQRTSRLEIDAILDKLQRVPGASWDPSRTCLANTRAHLIDEILEWVVSGVHKPSSGAQQSGTNETQGIKMLILTAVAGAGKTTIAHTVAQRCAQDRRLISSFFFDRETKDRNTPVALFTTIASDLSGLEKGLAQHIATAIEDDRSLLSAPIARQFEELVLRPCRNHTFSRPMVIVIDALDEAWDDDLFNIIQDRVHLLPDTVRLFLTVRMRPELDSLCQEHYAHRINLDITSQENLEDISEYARHKLLRLARTRKFDHDWPGDVLRNQFLATADGLFLWVATICDYLRKRDDPTVELEWLVKKTNLTGSSAEKRMDDLYANILESFDWTDENFIGGYNRVIGAAIASQVPITISAMKELYHNKPLASDFTLQRLSPLLTGMSESEHSRQPVRVLHQSLRDFLMIRSAHSPQYGRFLIIEKEKSAELALLSLDILNRELKHSMPVVGYLSRGRSGQLGVPKMQIGDISDAMWYACRFWPDHVCHTDGSNDMTGALMEFLENKLIVWLEVVTSCGQCRDLDKLQTWMQNHLNEREYVRVQKVNKIYATASPALISMLKYDDRFEEALTVAKHAVELYRRLPRSDRVGEKRGFALLLANLGWALYQLAQTEDALKIKLEVVAMRRQLAVNQPAAYTPDLARSLDGLSLCLNRMGRHQEALSTMQEAAEIYRRLAVEQPAVYTPELVLSLNSLSIRLSTIGRLQEALSTTQEAVEICRRVAAERLAAYTPNLAWSLNCLSNHLSMMGRHQEALSTTQEAAEIYRRLAVEQPAVYTPDLARSLGGLSLCLNRMGRRQEALSTMQEAAEIYRRLAAERPAVYTPNLAWSLDRLSSRLSTIGRLQEALSTTQEAVEICRRVAAERPAVYTPDLARSLQCLSNHLSKMGRHQEALSTTQEAVEIYRRLAAERPAAYNLALAGRLRDLSRCLSTLNRHQEALPATQEAILLYRPFTVSGPGSSVSGLQYALRAISKMLSVLGRHEESQAASDEANGLVC